jgi:plastocyanin
MHLPGTRLNKATMHLATACNSNLASKHLLLRLALSARVHYRYVQVFAVGREKEKEEVTLMRRIILLMTVAALVVVGTLLAVSVAGAQKHPTAKAQKHPTKTVLIQNFSFKPAHITIKRGTKVRWINMDFDVHTATANNGKSFDSGLLFPRQRYTHTFKRAGKQRYHCKIHPDMKASVVVKR